MRWIVRAYGTLKKEEALDEISRISNFARLQEYIYTAIRFRSKWGLIDDIGFQEIIDAYETKYRELTGRVDYYEPVENDIRTMITVAWDEWKKDKNNKAVECAVNLALKYYPNNEQALKLKETLNMYATKHP